MLLKTGLETETVPVRDGHGEEMDGMMMGVFFSLWTAVENCGGVMVCSYGGGRNVHRSGDGM